MNEKRTYKRYPVSFKEEAVALVTEQGYIAIEAAKSLEFALINSTTGKISLKRRSRVKPCRLMNAKS